MPTKKIGDSDVEMDRVVAAEKKRLKDSESDGGTPRKRGDNGTKSRAWTYEDAVDQVGLGKWHLWLTLACGWANASDAVEVLCVSLVLPSIQYNMDVCSYQLGYLTAIVFVGMMLGGYFWGSIGMVCSYQLGYLTAIVFVGMMLGGYFWCSIGRSIGWANASDAVEVLCVSLVLPSIQYNMDVCSYQLGYLTAIVFVGMMLGGYFWCSIGRSIGWANVSDAVEVLCVSLVLPSIQYNMDVCSYQLGYVTAIVFVGMMLGGYFWCSIGRSIGWANVSDAVEVLCVSLVLPSIQYNMDVCSYQLGYLTAIVFVGMMLGGYFWCSIGRSIGWANVSDAVEVLCVSLVLPSIQYNMNVCSYQLGYLTAIVFVGMMLGGYFWCSIGRSIGWANVSDAVEVLCVSLVLPSIQYNMDVCSYQLGYVTAIVFVGMMLGGYFWCSIGRSIGWANVSDAVEVLCVSLVLPSIQYNMDVCSYQLGYVTAIVFVGMMLGGYFWCSIGRSIGWANVSDAVEVLCVSLVLPSIQYNMDVCSYQLGYLTAIVFVGMMLGGYFWCSIGRSIGWANVSDAVEVLCVSLVLPSIQYNMDVCSYQLGYLTAIVFVGMMLGGYFWCSIGRSIGWANVSDAVEVLCVSLVLPSIQYNMDVCSYQLGYVTAIVFVGMMLGGYFWGSIGDSWGRRPVMIAALFVNGLFGFISAFMTNFWWFLFFRFLSGVGVGGSIPVIWSYYCEFLPSNVRGRMLSIIATFWMIGTLIFAGIGWIIVPREDLEFMIGTYHFQSWRIFVVVSTLLCITSSIIVSFLPESPKFLVEKGKEKEALATLAKVYAKNTGNLESDYPVRRLEPPTSEAWQVLGSGGRNEGTFMILLRQTRFLFSRALIWTTLVVLVINFSLSFGSYGLSFWLPELFSRAREAGTTGTLCQRITNASHSHVAIANASHAHVNGPDTGCVKSKSPHIDPSVYRDTFIINSCSLPGNLLTVFFLDRLGRRPVFFAGAALSAIAVMGIFFVKTSAEVLIMSCVFNATSVLCWNCMDAFAVELFPTEVRATAMGVGLLFARIGAILGNTLFGLLIDQYCSVPIVLVAVMMAIAGLASLRLRETTNVPLE